MDEALTTILFVSVLVSLMALAVRRLDDIRLSNLQSGKLTPYLDAAFGNGDASAIVTLCHNYDDSWLGRIVKSVITRAEGVAGSDGVRSEALRLLIDQAAGYEKDRIRRGLGTLRTAAIVSVPLGVAVGALTANSARSAVELSDAMLYATEGFVLSIACFAAYKYLSAKVDAALDTLEELCDHLHGLLLLRSHEV